MELNSSLNSIKPYLDGCTVYLLYNTIPRNFRLGFPIVITLIVFLMISIGGVGARVLPNAAYSQSSSPPPLPLTQLSSSASGIPSASTIYNSETLMLPPSVKGVIIFLPNEAHELTPNQRMGEKNGEFLPLNVVIGAGASVAVLNGDAGHIHTISLGGNGDSSTPYAGTALFPGLTAGSYDIVAGGVVRHGKVTVTPTPASGSTTVGLIYVPTELVPKFKSAFAAAGFSVLSEFNYSKKVGRINENTVLVYSTNQDIQMAVQKLPAIAMMNTYT
jgi:hypothetical protein